MPEHPNATVYRRYLEMLGAGDVDGVAPMIANEVVWHEPGGTASIEGREALLGQMQAVTGHFDLDLVLHDVVANDDHTVALYEMIVEAEGKKLNARIAEIWHVSDGSVTERWAFTDDPGGFASFFTG